ncbi:MAG: FtsH protease activity modulator HflK [Gammaproteobacteria bacterium]|nr:FtsH protease activity modulator HflK [Gammaproteobacteria bacterium]
MSFFFRSKPNPQFNLGGPQGPNRGNTPPDLEEVFDKFLGKIKDLKDKKRPSGLGGGGGGSKSKPFDFDLRYIVLALVAGWVALGVFIVDEREQAVKLQFGKYSETLNPGLHWIALGIQSQETVDMKTVRSRKSQAELLTGDENIISLEYEMQFVILDIQKFLFNVRDPFQTVQDVVESSVREIVGINNMDYLLTEGRSFVGDRSTELGQRILDEYNIGISLQTVNIISAQPPDPVQGSFSDANKAREDEQRYINEAEVYNNEILPKARGQARELVEEAKAHRFRVIESAKGETDRFKKVYVEYKKAPAITRERLYLETMEKIMQRSNKIFIDADNTKPFLYIPSVGGERRLGDTLSSQQQSDALGPAAIDLLKR